MPHMQDLFDSKTKARCPKVVVAPDGSVLAFRSCAELRRSEDAGETWSAPVGLGEGGGNVIVDEAEGVGWDRIPPKGQQA